MSGRIPSIEISMLTSRRSLLRHCVCFAADDRYRPGWRDQIFNAERSASVLRFHIDAAIDHLAQNNCVWRCTFDVILPFFGHLTRLASISARPEARRRLWPWRAAALWIWAKRTPLSGAVRAAPITSPPASPTGSPSLNLVGVIYPSHDAAESADRPK